MDADLWRPNASWPIATDEGLLKESGNIAPIAPCKVQIGRVS